MHFIAVLTAIASLAVTHTLAAPLDPSNLLIARAEQNAEAAQNFQAAQDFAAKYEKASTADKAAWPWGGPWGVPWGFGGGAYSNPDGSKYGYGSQISGNGFTFNNGATQFGYSKDGWFLKTPQGNYDLTRGIRPDGTHFTPLQDPFRSPSTPNKFGW
ncbi:Hypothetical predicted protein [Lecanosticta acicola]|uniref:Uncharacterized protein n=1 Tax=Lecanosticta acicola TaxID=111012 RepID=A0AAI8YX36_9PEZI|nr:Hypothetical predicted protein [Lecanosticta acicola]